MRAKDRWLAETGAARVLAARWPPETLAEERANVRTHCARTRDAMIERMLLVPSQHAMRDKAAGMACRRVGVSLFYPRRRYPCGRFDTKACHWSIRTFVNLVCVASMLTSRRVEARRWNCVFEATMDWIKLKAWIYYRESIQRKL